MKTALLYIYIDKEISVLDLEEGMDEVPCQLWIGRSEHCPLDVTDILESWEKPDGFDTLFEKEAK